jgi:hypothetical protein
MHIEVLVEDSSGARLVEMLLPRVIGAQGEPHTWRVHDYGGVGRIPKKLTAADLSTKKTLLDRLPGILQAHGKTPGIDAVVVVLDSDRRDCKELLAELQALLTRCDPAPNALFRLAIEEMEAWLLGDRAALLRAYPKAKKDALSRYVQDSVCGTWEALADAVHPGGSAAIRKAGWPLPGQVKHEWVQQIGPHLDIEQNVSPSFCKFRDGLRRLTTTS